MKLPSEVPVMTLPAATLFPQALLPLYIFEPRYRQMLADMLLSDRMFSVAMQKPGRVRETPCQIAGLGLIRVSVDHKDGTSHLILQGLTRVQLGETLKYKPYRIQSIRPLPTLTVDSVVIDALVAKVFELVRQRLELGGAPFPMPVLKKDSSSSSAGEGETSGKFSIGDILHYLENLPDADQVSDLVACALLSGPVERQTILETVNLEDRLKHLVHFLMAEIRQHKKNKNP
jgi:Lon protease-like protein